jgi:hypothetical protein
MKRHSVKLSDTPFSIMYQLNQDDMIQVATGADKGVVELGSTTKIMLNNQIVICRPHSRQPSFRVFGNSALVASQVML